jgi:hypothetical protein
MNIPGPGYYEFVSTINKRAHNVLSNIKSPQAITIHTMNKTTLDITSEYKQFF